MRHHREHERPCQDVRERGIAAGGESGSAEGGAGEVAELGDAGSCGADRHPVVGGRLEPEGAGGEGAAPDGRDDEGEQGRREQCSGSERSEQGRAGGCGEAEA